jgi:uncharacterized membrane protein
MSELIVAAFRGTDSAAQALEKLLALEPAMVADVEDAVVAVREADGKVRLRQTADPLTTGATRGFAWGGLLGTLAGLLLLNPIAGLAAGLVLGAGAGAVSGALADYGIADDFIRDTARELEPGSSALFLLLRQVAFERLARELEPFGARITRTPLTPEQEQRLKKAVAGVHPPP